jgi:ABC-2 type transport system permease protein
MATEMRYTIARLRGQIVGWGIAVAALGLILVAFYDIFEDTQQTLTQMIESYPPELLAFFGGDAEKLMTPEGFLGMYGFSMLPLIVGIFAVLVGANLIAGDEENGRLDLIVAYPVSRSGLFLGRVLAFVAASVGIMVVGWLGFSVLLGGSSLDVTWVQMALPFISLLAQVLIFGSIALLLSLVLPARRMAAMVAGAVLVASYFLSSLSAIDERLASLARFLPYDYFQGGDAIGGLNLGWLFGLIGLSVLLTLVAWRLFLRRDIRIAGEGSWRLPTIRLLRREAAEKQALD